MPQPDAYLFYEQHPNDRSLNLLMIVHGPAEVERKNRLIYQAMIARSANIKQPNFTRLGSTDLRLMFELYDAEFFDGLLSWLLREQGAAEVVYRLSNRLTRAAGKTFYQRRRIETPTGIVERPEYEIAVSTFLLFQNFRPDHQRVTVNGLVCVDRLTALQGIFEHELLHLAEFLVWGRSSCAASPFRALSQQIFGHAEATHELITPHEVAREVYQVQIGDMVSFEWEGARHVGRVNRITKRATILVEHPAGQPFSDGNRYNVFYVPMSMLRKEGSEVEEGQP